MIHHDSMVFPLFLSNRIHITKLYKGRKSILGKRNPSSESTVVASFKYAGYQIAHMFWGYIIVALLLFVILTLLILLIIRPLVKGQINWLLKIILPLW